MRAAALAWTARVVQFNRIALRAVRSCQCLLDIPIHTLGICHRLAVDHFLGWMAEKQFLHRDFLFFPRQGPRYGRGADDLIGQESR